MPVSSTPSKRLALAPVSVNVNSPLRNDKSGCHSYAAASLSLTPPLSTKISLTKSASSIVPRKHGVSPARKMESFADYKITNSRNVKADLAATKLKLRLQLAIYKLKMQRNASKACSPNIRVSKTPHKPIPRFSSSANVNLQRPKPARMPRLSTVASSKTGNHLKLFHIKPSSPYHNSHTQRLPLTSANSQRLPPVHKILRTPIKAANRTLMSAAHANGDDTIDETFDEPDADSYKKKNDIFGSSPMRYSSFGTPNSFSVAKSLLQLGSGHF